MDSYQYTLFIKWSGSLTIGWRVLSRYRQRIHTWWYCVMYETEFLYRLFNIFIFFMSMDAVLADGIYLEALC